MNYRSETKDLKNGAHDHPHQEPEGPAEAFPALLTQPPEGHCIQDREHEGAAAAAATEDPILKSR